MSKENASELYYTYGILTSLVDESEMGDNFLSGFKYKDNFKKVFNFINTLSSLVDYDIDVVNCFNNNSDDKYESTFRSIIIRPSIENLKKKDVKALYDFINESEELIEIMETVKSIKYNKDDLNIKVIFNK